jgi:hypothetical protein
MQNSSNNNSYLILYLVIILVLLYAITFMSGYTCNVAVQSTDTFKKKENFNNSNKKYYPNGVPVYPYEDFENNSHYRENFESGSGGDFTIVGIGSNTLYTLPITNNGQSGWINGGAVNIPSSGDVIDICVLKDGSFVGVGTNNQLYTRASLTATWVGVNNTSMKFAYITQQSDGSFLATDTAGTLYRLDALTSWPSKVHDPELGKVIQLQDKSYLAVGGGGLETLYTMDPWFQNMKQITDANTVKITYVQQGPDGTIYGLLNGNTFAKKNLADLTNASIPWTNTGVCCFTGFAITQSAEQKSPGTMAAAPLTANDYTLFGVGKNNQVYMDDVYNNVTYPNPAVLANSGNVTDIGVGPTGIMYGVGMDGQLFSKQTLNSSWVNMQMWGRWKGVSMMNDGHTLVLVGTDANVYTFDTANNNGGKQAQMIPSKCCVCKVIQLQDNTFLATGGGGCDTLYTLKTFNDNWAQVSKSDIGITSIAQTPGGSILGLKSDGVYIKGADWNTWTKTTWNNTNVNYIAIATTAIPPQTINGYDRKGVFVDDSARTIPNFIGNYNTLPECIAAAKGKGYNTVGYQYMNQCFGGNNSPYDRLGFQNNNQVWMSAYPGANTNVVYKTGSEMVTTSDPTDGEVFVYQACQFTGAGSKMTIGQYPNLPNTIGIKSVKLGPSTKLTLYSQPNFQGTIGVFYGNSDSVNMDAACMDFTFSSAKVEKYTNALPSKPADLTEGQLNNLWMQAGCKSESIAFTPSAITFWRGKSTISDVISDMKNWATLPDPKHKQGCYTLAPQPDVPDEGEVVLFENCDYGGRYKKYGLGNVAFVGNDFNDLTSSIKIGPYTSLSIYADANFGGKTMTWKNDSTSVSNVDCLTANSFNDMLSSLKVTSSTAQVNNILSLQAQPVFVLGPWNISTWNVPSFADTTAQWIWYTKGANVSAPVDSKPVRFQLLVPITGNRDIPVTINVIADDAPQGANFVRVNGKLVGQILAAGWLTPNYSKIETVMAPGNNLVEFDVQNTGGAAGLLASIINTNTFEVIANSGNGQWGWVDPSKVVSSVLTEEVGSEFVIHDEAAKGKIVTFKNLNEIPQMTVGGTFRLTVNLKSVPPYIKGQQYKDGDTNQFYLSIEKLDPNCQVEDGNKCLNIFVDNKKCTNATLSNVSKINAYRLVLVSKAYVLDPNIPFGKNVDFTIVKVGEKYYLKNIQTGYMPKLFTNDFKQQLYGYMDENYLSNLSTIKSNTNKLCGAGPVAETEQEENTGIGNIFGKAMSGIFGGSQQSGPKADQKFVNCFTNADGSMYMMSTTNLAESNPVKFVLNKDGTVNIRLQSFNSYGNIDKTYSLVFCNFNVNTYAFIEKLTNPLGTFLINMVCFDPDDKRQLPNNTLNFSFEISKYPDSYLKEKNIYNLNS